MAESNNSNQSFNSVVAYKISDLMLAVRIEELCIAKGKQFSRVNSFDALAEDLNGRILLVCDLTIVSKDLIRLKNISEQKRCRIFGYHPHVDKEVANLAQRIGIDYVVPRSALQSKLRLLLS